MLFFNKDNGFNYACISDDIPLSFCFCGGNWRKAHDYIVIDELTDRTSKHGGDGRNNLEVDEVVVMVIIIIHYYLQKMVYFGSSNNYLWSIWRFWWKN